MLSVTPDWYIQTLRSRIKEIDWAVARQNVPRFIPTREQDGIALWNRDFFLYHADQLARYLILERFTIEVSRCSTKKTSRLPRREKPLRTLV